MEEDAENRDDDPRDAQHPVRIVFPHQASPVHHVDEGFGLGFSKSTICEISAASAAHLGADVQWHARRDSNPYLLIRSYLMELNLMRFPSFTGF